MRGSLKCRSKGRGKNRGKNRYAIILDLGSVVDPATGKKKRKQKWISFYGTPKAADDQLIKLVGSEHDGTFVNPAKTTLIEHLRSWHAKHVAPRLRPNTARVYLTMIEHVANAPIAHTPIQKVRTSDIEAFYASVTLSPASVGLLHAVMLGALRLAVRDRLLVVNPAAGAKRPTAKPTEVNDLHAPCWSGTEARQFLKAAKEAGPQPSALFSLAIDTGARKGELLGLRWADVDLEAGLVRIHRQLDGMEEKGPLFGPTKTKRGRTVEISAETVTRLRLHKSTQAELKLKNRRTYRDYGLVFAKQPEDLQTQKMHIGDPADTLCERAYDRLITAAGLRRITFHGLRHTCATLLLQAGTPVTTVSKRLGHSTVSMTLNIYSHVMPGDQAGAAATMGGILY